MFVPPRQISSDETQSKCCGIPLGSQTVLGIWKEERGEIYWERGEKNRENTKPQKLEEVEE